MASKKKQMTLARHAAVQDAVTRQVIGSFVHETLVPSGPARSVPSDVRSLARAISTCPNWTGRSVACRCVRCESGRRLLASTMPTGMLTPRGGLSVARFDRKDLDLG